MGLPVLSCAVNGASVWKTMPRTSSSDGLLGRAGQFEIAEAMVRELRLKYLTALPG
jgi:hypothetical protein